MSGEAHTSSVGVVHGNPYDKYGTRNPIARRLMAGFDREMFGLLHQVGPVGSVLEVGCGEGHVTAKLHQFFPDASVTGSDVSPEIVDAARGFHPELTFEVRSVYEEGARGERFDLVVACEVFEHLDEPERALEVLARVSRQWIFLSVPREPIWRVLNLARGQYVSRLGNSLGHVQHWSRGGFVQMLSRHVDVVGVRSPLPWTQALCRVRGTKA